MTPPLSRLIGFPRAPETRIFRNFVYRPNFLICSSKWSIRISEIWPLNWNMTPQSKIFVSIQYLFIKNMLWLFLSINVQKTHFCSNIFFILRKRPEGNLGHCRASGVKFWTSPKVDNLYVKIALLTWAFQQSYSGGPWRLSKLENYGKRVKKCGNHDVLSEEFLFLCYMYIVFLSDFRNRIKSENVPT